MTASSQKHRQQQQRNQIASCHHSQPTTPGANPVFHSSTRKKLCNIHDEPRWGVAPVAGRR